MLVSWNWLSQYVNLDMSPDELATRFALSGLNHESTTMFSGDPVIDLEVTSNRGDCLSHIGIAREAAVLYQRQVCMPKIELRESEELASKVLRVTNLYPAGCARYTARVIRGVKVGPSPEWMVKRLNACGIKSVNNVVDVTNYVMFECGQPLHAFDLKKIEGGEIIVRAAEKKENFLAIDHRNYALDPSMIVIADARRAVALGGVMGGVDSEVSDTTVDLLIEAADFTPLLIRRAARSLKLQSPASHRFERKVDPGAIDWASQRCCQLILEVAGGVLLRGMVDSGSPAPKNDVVPLRKTQVTRVLGMEVPWSTSLDILQALGCKLVENDAEVAKFLAPSWRHDLTREIDLIEEVARIYGYERIPEDAVVPTMTSSRREKDVLLDRVRSIACAAGFDEALTPSVVTKGLDSLSSPWCDAPTWTTRTQLLEGATHLRRTLVPSLLHCRLHNQSHGNRDVHLFENAVIYLQDGARGALPSEQVTFGFVSTGDLRHGRGLLEEIVARCNRQLRWTEESLSWSLIENGTGLRWIVEGKCLAYFGLVSKSVRDQWKLDGDVTVGELNMDLLLEHLQAVPKLVPLIPFPAIERDLNLVVEETLTWGKLAGAVTSAGGPMLSRVDYKETYRDPNKDGAGKKRILLSIAVQSSENTLTSAQADEVVSRIIAACESQFAAKLLA